MLLERSTPSAASLRRARSAALMMSCSVLALLVASEAHAERLPAQSPAAAAARATSAAATQQSAAAAAIANRSNQALQDAAKAVQGVLNAQTQARIAAQAAAATINAGIGRGLTESNQNPGLQVDPRVRAGQPSLWIGAKDPAYQVGNEGTVYVERTAAQTVTTWKYFNLSGGTVVDFDHGIQGGQKIGDYGVQGGQIVQGVTGGNVLVRVDGTMNSSGMNNASKIYGEIKCTCQLTLINPFGIKIGGTAKIETRGFAGVAGLDINSNQSASVFAVNGLFSPKYVTQLLSDGDTVYVPPSEATANLAFAAGGLLPNAPTSTANASGASGGYSGLFSMGSMPDGTPNSSAFVQVDPGAMIRTTLGDNGAGGYVMLLGPKVTNAGTIITQNGQVILAAGSNVILQEPYSTDKGVNTAFKVTSFEPGLQQTINGNVYDVPTTFSGLGGLATAANGQTVTIGGQSVTQPGLIISIDGAVTMVGDIVQQSGAVLASTSVTRAGSITFSTPTGTLTPNDVVLGSNSLTAIAPDTLLKNFEDLTNTDYVNQFGSFIPANFDSTGGTTPASSLTGTTFQDQIQPKITINTARGAKIGANALVYAPSAAVNISSTDTSGHATVLLDAGSRVELGGLTTAKLPMSANAVSILVTANEVADTPLARSLIGKTVIVDARLSGTRADGLKWVGSPILNAQGYIDKLPRTLDQILTVGGSFKVSGVQNFIQAPANSAAGKPAASINVSGGYVTYTGGELKTTQLLGSNNQQVDIGKADPNFSYTIASSILDSATNFNQPGYVTGGKAGTVDISAVVPILQGTIYGDVAAGPRQRAGLDAMPTGADLKVTFFGNSNIINTKDVILEARSAVASSDPYGLSGVDFVFGQPNQTVWNPTLTNGKLPVFTDVLSANPLGSVSIKGQRDLSMSSAANLTVQPGGSITLDNVSFIDGKLNAPGGTIALSGFTYPQNTPLPLGSVAPDPLTIGSHAVLNVRGLWVNDSGLLFDDVQGAAYINGGSITISTQPASKFVRDQSNQSQFADVTQSIVLAPGSVIDVSSGGYVTTLGKLKFGSDGLPLGKGGSLSLLTYNGNWESHTASDQNIPSNSAPTSSNFPNQANITLGGTIYSGGFDGGGTLTLQAPTITIDKDTTLPTTTTDGVLKLPANYFARSGFSNYVLTSRYGGITVTENTRVDLQQTGFSPFAFVGALPNSGAVVRDFMPVALAPDGLRKPVNLTLAQYAFPTALSGPALSAGITLGLGASIVGDSGASAGSSVTFAGGGPVSLYGSIVAHGGSINLLSDPTLTAVANVSNNNTVSSPDRALAPPNVVWISESATLDVSGTFVRDPRVTSRSGTLFDGGTITVAAPSIIVQPGADFRLNGAKDRIDVATMPGNLNRSGSQDIWSNGGTLQLGGEHIYFAGSVSAQGGAPLAAGGSLVVGQIAVPSALTPYITTTTASPLFKSPDAVVVEPVGAVAASLQGIQGSKWTGQKQLPTTQAALQAFLAKAQGQSTAQPTSLAFFEADVFSPNIPNAPLSGMLNASGFDSITFNTGSVAFAGPIELKVPGSLTFNASGSTAKDYQIVLLKPGTSGTDSKPLSGLLPDALTNGDPASYAVTCSGSSCIPDIGSPTVDIQAGYVRIVGRDVDNGHVGVPKSANGTLNVSAKWIDLQNAIAISNAQKVNLTSDDAVRMLPDNYGAVTVEGTPRPYYVGALFTSGNLKITAAEVYPATNTQFLLMSFGTNDASTGTSQNNTISIVQKENTTGHAPLSAGGMLVIDAQNIEQNGTLWAPLGQIILGLSGTSTGGQADTNRPIEFPVRLASPLPDLGDLLPVAGSVVATTKVTLGPNSVTSVSAKGLTLPYGYTIDDTTWYQGVPGASSSLATILSLPPEKRISLNVTADISKNPIIDQKPGSILDLSGGGDIYATEFVSGTGGSRNVLTTYNVDLATPGVTSPTFTSQYPDGRQVYALVPTYGANVAAYDPTFANYPYFSGVSAPAGTNLTNFPIVKGGAGIAFGNAIAPGMSITIGAGNGIPAGTYTLLPGMYATMPGAYRVVQVASGVSSQTQSYVAQDGSNYVTGYFGNQLTGSRSALASTFLIQSAAVWQNSSDIHIASGNTFFRQQAQAANAVVPPLPIDGGTLTISAANALNLNGSNNFLAADGGLDGQLQIAASKILVTSGDRSGVTSDTLILTTQGIDDWHVSRLLLGGTAVTDASTGVATVTATATDLEVRTNRNDQDHQLKASEILLVTKAGGSGLNVTAGSEIVATGSQGGRDLAIGSDGALIRVSNGAPVNITRTTTGSLANLAIGANVLIQGNSIAIDTSGTGVIASAGVTLAAKNYDFGGTTVNIGNGVPTASTAKALTISADLLNGLVAADGSSPDSIKLRSASYFNLYDQNGLTLGSTQNGKQIGTLTLSGSGLVHAGGNTTIYAKNVVLADSNLTASMAGATPLTGTGGSLNIHASDSITVKVEAAKTGTSAAPIGAVTMLLGGDGSASTPGSFQDVKFKVDHGQIAFAGAGSTNQDTTSNTSTGTPVTTKTTTAGVLNAFTANVELNAAAIVAMAGSTQTLKTTGALSLPTKSTGAVAQTLGGVLKLSAASISGSGTVAAPSGSVTLEATAGDIRLDDGARIITAGSVVKVLDNGPDGSIRYAPGGLVQLTASSGAVTINDGATVDVSSAIDDKGVRQGYAGSLTIQSKNAATLKGTLRGDAGFNELGGDFSLQAGGLTGGSTLPLGSFTRSFAVALDQGDITIAAGDKLTSGRVTLTANSGSVVVDGTIDASGPSGNFISLFGASNVTVGSGAKLLANFRALSADNPAAHQATTANGQSAGDATINLVQNGGTITLGTTGTPDVDGAGATKLDTTYGYEQVTQSGRITVNAGATFNVSGGAGGDGISNNAGSIILRAPIVNVLDSQGHVTGRTVNVAFGGTVFTNATGAARDNTVMVNAYAAWSTKDTSTGGQHFDGIIDPAGWYDSTGTRVAGTTTGYANPSSGNVVVNPAGTACSTPTCITRTTNDSLLFKPTVANQSHVDFYQKTLVSFVQDFNQSAKSFNLSADFTNAKFGDTGGALSGSMRPEISLINPEPSKNGGNITVASNWNLGGTTDATKPFAPSYRTSDGNPGTLTLRAVNNININATVTDGFYETTDAFGGSVPVANLIANNPQLAGNRADLNTTSAASLMGITPGSNNGSFSYDFVAGANFTNAVNPDAVGSTSGNVVIDKHTSYIIARQLGTRTTVNVPTMVRTGTGSIRITAGGDFKLADTTAPGVVYTAGAAATLPDGFTAPSVPAAYAGTPTGLVATPTWATNGGSVTVTAGGSITGIETWGTNAGQFWSDWYAHSGLSNGTSTPFAGCTGCQTASWINYNTFFQGVGALGGGNVTLTAGQDITAISVSLPETLAVSGGRTADSPPVAHYYGGGNLLVRAGRNLNAGDFLVGRGSGTINVGGNVQHDAKTTGTTGIGILPLMLAVQDGFISLNAYGSVTLGNIYDPASLPSGLSVQTSFGLLPGGNGIASVTSGAANRSWSNPFTSYGPQSGISINSTAGDINALTILTNDTNGTIGTMFAHGATDINSNGITSKAQGQLLPATLDLTALSGGVTINLADTKNANLLPYPAQGGSATGNLSIVAKQTINLGAGFAMPDLNTQATQYLGYFATVAGTPRTADLTNYVSPLGIPLAPLTQPLHANDPDPVVIAAGQDIIFNNLPGSSFRLIKPANIQAGQDIRWTGQVDISKPQPLLFAAQNNNDDDLTSIVAGRDILGGAYALYGPGDFLLQAGRNLGPLYQSDATTGMTNGILAIGNGSNSSGQFGGSTTAFEIRPYLPAKSANIHILFGIKPGVNYQDAIAQYVDPAKAGTGGIDFLSYIAKTLGKSPDDAWTEFKNLPEERQHLLVNQAFLKFLTQVATDYRDSASPYFLQYARAYTAITTMFPPDYGYTDNAGGSGTSAPVKTGQFNMAQALVATQQGSDINIIGPGGAIVVGSSARDALKPLQEGILTLSGGSIRAFSDSSILLNQSRILTVQGGDVDLFSANGDINAGSGPKTYVSNPPIQLVCNQTALCEINPSGLVSGAGIGALITVPGQDPNNSNVTLVAPHGIIDAGAAGLRAGGNFNAVALQVLNAYNIAVQGNTQGVPVAPVSVSTTVGPPPADQSGTKQATEVSTTQSSSGTRQPSIVIVEVLGYGGRTVTGSTGGTDSAPTNSTDPDDKKKKEDGEQAPAQP